MAEEETSRSTIVELLIKAVDELTEPIEKAEKSLRGLIGDVKEAAAATVELYSGYEAMARFIEPAEEMQNAQVGLTQALSLSAEQLQEAHEQADRLAVAYGLNAAQITDAQAILGRQFGELEKSMEAADVAAKIAVATHSSIAVAAEQLGQAYHSMADPSKSFKENLDDIANMLAVLQTKFLGSHEGPEMMMRDLARVASTARSMHIDMNQAVAVLAEFSRTGAGGGRGAGIQVVRLMDEIMKTNKHNESAWSKFHLQVVRDVGQDVDLLATLQRAATMNPKGLEDFIKSLGISGLAAELLVKNLKDMPEVLEKIEKRQHALDEAMAPAMATLTKARQQFFNSIDVVFTAIGEQMLNPLIAIFNALTNATMAVDDFAKAHEWLYPILAGVVALFATIVTLAGLFGVVVGYLALVATSLEVLGVTVASVLSPLLIFIAVIGLIGYAVIWHWDVVTRTFREAAEEIRWTMHEIQRFMVDPWGEIKLAWESSVQAAKKLGSDIQEAFNFSMAHPWQALKAIGDGFMHGLAAQLASFEGGFKGFGWNSKEQAALNEKYYKLLTDGKMWTAIADMLGEIADKVAVWGIEIGTKLANGIVEGFKASIKALADIDWTVLVPDFAKPWLHIPITPKPPEVPTDPHSSGGRDYPVIPPDIRLHSAPDMPAAPSYIPHLVPPPGMHPVSYRTGGGGEGSNFTYAPNITINASAEGSDGIKAVVEKVMTDSKDEFVRLMRAANMDDRRTTYSDVAYT